MEGFSCIRDHGMSRGKPIGYYTDKQGRCRPIYGAKSSRGYIARPRVGAPYRGRSMFFDPRYKKYADMVRLRTPEEAEGSVRMLLEEFNTAETREKKLRVKRVTINAANRAEAAGKRKDLSQKEREEFKEIHKLYREAADEMVIPQNP